MTKQRRLADLYVVGRELTLADESGEEPIKVWLQKPNPIEYEKITRRAGAAKARLIMLGRDKESDFYLGAYAEINELGDRDAQVDYLLSEELVHYADAREAELAAEEGWSKDGYLQGLRDAWIGNLQYVYADKDETHEDWDEAQRVFGELQRFENQVNNLVEQQRLHLRREYETTSLDEITDRCVRRLIDMRSQLAWVTEFRRSRIWLCVREVEDHKKQYFTEREEVDPLAAETLAALTEALDSLVVDGIEGKDLQPTQSSSESSEPPVEAETVQPSGPAVAAL